jgi:hypothetical protein
MCCVVFDISHLQNQTSQSLILKTIITYSAHESVDRLLWWFFFGLVQAWMIVDGACSGSTVSWPVGRGMNDWQINNGSGEGGTGSHVSIL